MNDLVFKVDVNNNLLNKSMSLSKQRQKLRHYKSLDNISPHVKDTSRQKKLNKNQNFDSSKINKSIKKNGSSRFVTEIYDRNISKQQAAKYSQFFKNPLKGKRQEKKPKHQMSKNNSTTQIKKAQKVKMNSPLVNKLLPKKQSTQFQSNNKNAKKDKKLIKKDKNKSDNYFQKSPTKFKQFQSIMTQKHEKKNKTSNQKSHEKTRQYNSQNQAKKTMRKNRTQFNLESSPFYLMNDDIEIIDMIGQGTFGKVFRGKCRKTGEIIAIKRVLQDSKYKNRQMQIIKMLKNDFVVEVLGSFVTYDDKKQYLNIMMRYYEENLYNRINFYKETRINNLEAKIILYQLFKGLSYLHSFQICHRDIKPENILLKNCSAVICDFGSAKVLKSNESNISYICARCYRAPQLIFGATHYTTVVDIWSAGCVILELLYGQPFFIGETSINHLLQIMRVMGTPTEQQVLMMNPDYEISDYRVPIIQKTPWKAIFPYVDELLLQVIDITLVYNPNKRARAVQVLAHKYFNELRDKFTYQHIKCQHHLKDFFNFSQQELRGFTCLEEILIPKWYIE